MYERLNQLMAEFRVKQSDIAELLGKRPATISDKLRGLYPFTLNEAMAIRDEFFPEEDIDELFKKD